ncbi:DHA2 family efflux MFS transporter permease subunit [Actinoallomurus sp. NPDC050550]|uniref:DHA2 family efflux MFS transporter permease subunit n=1 Tax=Actinoallomurus sp. NPDC050550 TaxID=3154937 RepID=UPI0033E8BFF9
MMTSPVLVGSGPPPPSGGRARLRWPTLGILAVSLLIVGLDATVLNVALPTLVRELGASTGRLQWIVDIYALMAGGLMLLGGSLADRLGRKRVFLAGLALFTGASVAAAYAGSVTTLMAARAVMGIGEALIMPSTLAIIGDVFPDRAERTKAIGVWSAAVGAGTVIGPVLGGWLLSRFFWGSVFLINLPIGLVGLIAAALVVPGSRASVVRRIDPLGATLSVAAPAALLWAIIEGPTRGWRDPAVLGAFLLGLVLVAVFITWEGRTPHPMLPLRVFRHRALAIGDVLIFMAAFAMIGTLFVLTQYLQFVLGYSAAQTGWRLGPMALALLATGPLAGLLLQRLGLRVVSAAGLALVLAALITFGTTADGDGYGRVVAVIVLLGAGAGFVITATSDAIVGSLPDTDLGVGSATNSSGIQLGAATGVAVMGSLLSGRYGDELGRRLGAGTPSGVLRPAKESLGTALLVAQRLPGRAGGVLADAAKSSFVAGMAPALFTAAGVTVLGLLVALFAARRSVSHR